MESLHTFTGPEAGGRLLIRYSMAPLSFDVEASSSSPLAEQDKSAEAELSQRLGQTSLNGHAFSEGNGSIGSHELGDDIDSSGAENRQPNSNGSDSPRSMELAISAQIRERAKERYGLIVSYILSKADESGRFESDNVSRKIRDDLGFENGEGTNDFATLMRMGILTIEKERPEAKRYTAVTVHSEAVEAAIKADRMLPLEETPAQSQVVSDGSKTGLTEAIELSDGQEISIQRRKPDTGYQMSRRVRREVDRETASRPNSNGHGPAASGSSLGQSHQPAIRIGRRNIIDAEKESGRNGEKDKALSGLIDSHNLTAEEVSALPNDLYYMLALTAKPLVKNFVSLEMLNSTLGDVTGLSKEARRVLTASLIRGEYIVFSNENNFSLRLTHKGKRHLAEQIEAVKKEVQAARTVHTQMRKDRKAANAGEVLA